HFDSELQFLASLGYAVLQVNFRGSEGYGRAFREAGKRNFGRLIEDDIDLALQAVLKTEPVDGERMCMLGSSYGGFSALVASVRWPE
ncbi:prolyl oligopeptidase family serine peptidase, partial [Vogesella mureinivorans]|uniref:prolyl oligopeptidase family serine peptidase n=1 Tax=Vogesella mureinivorans TaxID=657276 RepID=UPI0011C88FC4